MSTAASHSGTESGLRDRDWWPSKQKIGTAQPLAEQVCQLLTLSERQVDTSIHSPEPGGWATSVHRKASSRQASQARPTKAARTPQGAAGLGGKGADETKATSSTQRWQRLCRRRGPQASDTVAHTHDCRSAGERVPCPKATR